MGRYRCLKYKDDPIVSLELVKFLAVNTVYEALNVLSVKMASMETNVAAMKKEVAGASKAAHSPSNKSDETKKFFDQLLKRVAKLEAQK
jgi:hypothetical protein